MPTFKPGRLDNEELRRTQPKGPLTFSALQKVFEDVKKFNEEHFHGTVQLDGTVIPDKAQTVSTTRLVMLLDLATLTVEEIGSKAKRRNYKGLKVWEKKLLALAEKALAQP